MFVSSRRRELKLLADNTDRSIKCSSPEGDVSWNILPRLRPGRQPPFVSPRRRELKYVIRDTPEVWASVRLLTETWVEIFSGAGNRCCIAVRLLTETWIEISSPYLADSGTYCSSPYGDVSWNAEAITLPKKTTEVRLLTETWIEIVADGDNSANAAFVSLRRRELKYLQELLNPHLPSSSPYGDVSWNNF